MNLKSFFLSKVAEEVSDPDLYFLNETVSLDGTAVLTGFLDNLKSPHLRNVVIAGPITEDPAFWSALSKALFAADSQVPRNSELTVVTTQSQKAINEHLQKVHVKSDWRWRCITSQAFREEEEWKAMCDSALSTHHNYRR
jgi:hypothetical protein